MSFDGRNCNLRQNETIMSVSPNIKKPTKHRASKEHYGWNPSTCACECDKA